MSLRQGGDVGFIPLPSLVDLLVVEIRAMILLAEVDVSTCEHGARFSTTSLCIAISGATDSVTRALAQLETHARNDSSSRMSKGLLTRSIESIVVSTYVRTIDYENVFLIVVAVLFVLLGCVRGVLLMFDRTHQHAEPRKREN